MKRTDTQMCVYDIFANINYFNFNQNRYVDMISKCMKIEYQNNTRNMSFVVCQNTKIVITSRLLYAKCMGYPSSRELNSNIFYQTLSPYAKWFIHIPRNYSSSNKRLELYAQTTIA